MYNNMRNIVKIYFLYIMEAIFYLGKNDLLNFSFPQLRLLAKHNLDIDSENLDKDTIAWLLAIKLLSPHHVYATMTPDKLWDKYKDSLTLKLQKDLGVDLDENVKQQFISADPSASNKYLQWIIDSYINNGIKKVKDLNSRVKPALEDFIILLNKKILKKGTKRENESNIYNYCGLIGCKKGKLTLTGLEDLLSKYDEILKNIHQQKEHGIKGRKEGNLIFKTMDFKIIQPLTEEAACYYGKGTKWCTAATQAGNLFEHYNKKGPFYIILPTQAKYPKEKYQLQFESNLLTDEKDESIGIPDLINRFPGLREWDKMANIEHQKRFEQAITNGNMVAVKLFLEDPGIDPTAYDNFAIRESSQMGHTEVVKLLLADGRADPAANSNEAIRWSSFNGHTDVVRLLLADGRADPTAWDNLPIIRSSQKGHADVVKLLLEDGRADPTVRNNLIISRSSENGHANVVRLLLEDGRADPTADDNWAIRLSSRQGHTDVVRLLLADGRVDPAADNNFAISASSENGHTDIVQLLLADGRANPKARDSHTLRLSSQKGHADVVKLLLEDGRADPTTMNNAAIKQAMEEEHEEIVELLLYDPRVILRS